MSNSNGGLMKSTVFDPINLNFYVNGDKLYGYIPEKKVSGDEDNLTFHFQITSAVLQALKALNGDYGLVKCEYDDEVIFEKRMGLTKYKVVFDEFIPSVFVTFEVK